MGGGETVSASRGTSDSERLRACHILGAETRTVKLAVTGKRQMFSRGVIIKSCEGSSLTSKMKSFGMQTEILPFHPTLGSLGWLPERLA